MRGAVALAAALAIPLETDAGAPFPERDLIIFLTLSVILATLVLQGLTLGPLIEWLGVREPEGEDEEEIRARLRTAEAAIARLEELADADWVYPDTIERARGAFDYRRRRFAARTGDGDDDEGYEDRSSAYQRLLREVLAAQRQELLAMRNGGEISDEVRRRIERDLDLEESRLESGDDARMSEPLEVERDGAVAIVTLDRPEKRNALSIELRELIAERFAELASDDEVACAVLTGAGSAFCSGMDTTQFGGDRAHKERLVECSVAAFGAVGSFPKPLIAAVNGPAVAGGFALAPCCATSGWRPRPPPSASPSSRAGSRRAMPRPEPRCPQRSRASSASPAGC